ncbi:hypothetical protein BCA37_00380 [Mycobacterium sp. djl-10]|nr:hypothetical protein BCA37_00380 [Mycobacterium sp. djl-10]
MTTQQDLLDAVAHIDRVTGDAHAWKQGLTPAEAAVLGLVVAPEAEVAAVVAKVRANHPTLFDTRTGAPVVPTAPVPPSADEQRGVGAAAIKKAETDLAHQNSATAQLDLLVIAAVLNAHSTTAHGGAELRRLQSEIENAVAVRTDLDTPAGARDFQRYLIGKLREIGAVVHNASLDDTSKAVLASAWTALYESAAAPKAAEPAAPGPAQSAAPAPALDALPAYGAELGPDPLLEQLLAAEPASAPAAAAAPAPPPASQAAAPPLGLPGLPTLGGSGGAMPPSAAGWPRAEELPISAERRGAAETSTLDDLLADADAALQQEFSDGLDAGDEPPEEDDPGTEEPENEPDDDVAAEESTQVRLPDGDVVTAASPQLAKAITSALAGTPIGDAFHDNGLRVPPPGTPVADPVDPADVDTGAVGMFTDRLAVALDRTRALHGGQVGPLSDVSGPSFLGWMPAPTPAATPAPTRPATTPAT